MKINISWKILIPICLLVCAIPVLFLTSLFLAPSYFMFGFRATEAMILLGLIMLAVALFANVASASRQGLVVRGIILGFLINTLIFIGEIIGFGSAGARHDYGFPFRFYDNSVGFGGEISIPLKFLWPHLLLDTIFWAVAALLILTLVRYLKNRFFVDTIVKRRTSILIVVVIILAILGANHFIYDFTPSRCDYKTIKVNKQNYKIKILSIGFGLQQIANEMSKKPEYTVEFKENDHVIKDPTEENPNMATWGSSLNIYRSFGNTPYKIYLADSTEQYGVLGRTEYGLSTELHPDDQEKIKCSTPNFRIRSNVKKMINDLPVSSTEKNELENNIEVGRLLNSQF